MGLLRLCSLYISNGQNQDNEVQEELILFELLNPEDEGTTILRNVENYSPRDTASHVIRITLTSVFLPRRTLAFKQCIFIRKNRKNLPDQTVSCPRNHHINFAFLGR